MLTEIKMEMGVSMGVVGMLVGMEMGDVGKLYRS